MCSSTILSSVLTGLVSGILASIILSLIYIWYQSHHRKYKYLEGKYKISSKFPDGVSDHGVLTIEVNGNTLKTKNMKSSEDFWQGEIRMDTNSSNSGKGFYKHIRDDAILWGYNEIQIKDPCTIFVHNSYSDKDCKLIVKGYVWEKRHDELSKQDRTKPIGPDKS